MDLQTCLIGSKEEPVHIGKLHLVVIEEYELSQTASCQHLGCNAPHASNPHHRHRALPYILVVVHDTHPLERHQAGVGVAVHHLRGGGVGVMEGDGIEDLKQGRPCTKILK